MGANDSKPVRNAPSAVEVLAPDTLLFMWEDPYERYILSKRSSPFVQFCLLAESLVQMRDRFVQECGTLGAVPPEEEDAGDGTFAVEVSPADLESGVRQRASVSPTRAAEHETYAVDVGAGAVPPEGAVRHAFGDTGDSTVVKLLSHMGNTPEHERYCLIADVKLWGAYRVYVAVREEDAGLIGAINSGAIDLVRDRDDPDAPSARERVDRWRRRYAADLIEHNTNVDTFVAKAGAFVTAHATTTGSTESAALARMAAAVGESRKAMLPRAAEDA